ncbi:hypothetical protein [Streptomyces sp. NPDC093225]|uniref:hypothetical protein n=1 Tax=Streptomyces sp. NPDC093225 TaxID=3366034 RepID=UPI003817C308
MAHAASAAPGTARPVHAASRGCGRADGAKCLPSVSGKVANPSVGGVSSVGNPNSDETKTDRFTSAVVAALCGSTGLSA